MIEGNYEVLHTRIHIYFWHTQAKWHGRYTYNPCVVNAIIYRFSGQVNLRGWKRDRGLEGGKELIKLVQITGLKLRFFMDHNSNLIRYRVFIHHIFMPPGRVNTITRLLRTIEMNWPQYMICSSSKYHINAKVLNIIYSPFSLPCLGL